jgi:phosphoglucosamine mutase
MISASHNPYEDNGIKLFGPDGFKMSDEVEREIEALMAGDLAARLSTSAYIGRAKRIESVHARYIEAAKRTLPRRLDLGGMRVVVDCANGAAYRVAPETLWELGAEVIPMGVEPDGLQHQPRGRLDRAGRAGPQGPGAARRHRHRARRRRRQGADRRRKGSDGRWRPTHGRGCPLVAGGRAPRQPGVVATIMSNLGLERFLGDRGLGLVRTAVGDRYVLEHMREHGYNLGGEQSGHIILSDYTTTGDGLIAALQVLAVVKRLDKPVSAVCHCFEPLPQILKNVRYRSGEPMKQDSVVTAIESGRQRLGNQGRLVIRPSGTEPVIRVMARATTATS